VIRTALFTAVALFAVAAVAGVALEATCIGAAACGAGAGEPAAQEAQGTKVGQPAQETQAAKAVQEPQVQAAISEVFPDIEGWEKDGPPELYTPETLFDYIDGGADLYLTYDFEELASQRYQAGDEKSITVDIYQQGTPTDGFGIYSQEKSHENDFLPIGTQGYYDPGVLNFFKGRYYVKIMAFGLGGDEVHVLTVLAGTVADKLEGDAVMPAPVRCFPEKNKIANSERYIAKDFLGHSFLHSAFVADYRLGEGESEKKFQVFIIEASDTSDAEAMVKTYLEKAAGGAIGTGHGEGAFRLEDPYYRSNGTLNLRMQGRFIWGLFGDDPAFYDYYLNKTAELLTENGLI
jgi:hypothetical protein